MSDIAQTCFATEIPTPRQLEFQDWEFGMVLHFGIRAFYEGHRDWDGKPMFPDQFNPSELDCDQWARVAKEAGVRYIVLTAKHHDGFCNWPSAYTDFTVANSPWKGGKGDVVREFTDACRRHGLRVGLYYSPADWKSPVYSDPKAYDEYFISQISELMTNYGEIDMLWFDGCGSEGHVYDWPRIIGEIRRMQPNILIFNMGDPDYRWVGNEAGIAPTPLWNTMDVVPFSIMTEEKAEVNEARPAWLPAECPCRMRLGNWFFEEGDIDTVKNVDELVGIYYYTVGRGCNLLINLGPDRRGLLPEPDATRLLAMGAEIKRRFAQPLVTLDKFTAVEGGWEYTPENHAILLDHLVVQEDLSQGEHVRRFAVEIFPIHYGDPITVFTGNNIGHKAICSFPPITARKVRLSILEADGEVSLRSLGLYCSVGR